MSWLYTNRKPGVEMTEPAKQDEWRVEVHDDQFESRSIYSVSLVSLCNGITTRVISLERSDEKWFNRIVNTMNAMAKVRELAEKLNEDMHCSHCYNRTDDGHESNCPLLALLDELANTE